MANTKAEKGGPATMTWLWMGVGIATTALFFWWVTVSSEPSQVVVAEEDAAAAAAAEADAAVQAVTLAELSGNPGEYLAEEVRIAAATITSVMGENAFWIEGQSGPFLIVKAPEFTLRDGAAVRTGEQVRITGNFWEQAPATIEQWRETGFMAGGDLLQAEFATHYIQAREIAPAEAAAAAEPATTGQ